jgi:hypothetical protein
VTLCPLTARVRRYYPRRRLNKVVTDYGASNEVAVQTGFLFDFYPVLNVLLEPSIRLGHFNVEPSQFRTGANEVVWEFSDIKCPARVLATGHIRRCDLLKREECNHGSVAGTACPENEKGISGVHNRGFLTEFLSLP